VRYLVATTHHNLDQKSDRGWLTRVGLAGLNFPYFAGHTGPSADSRLWRLLRFLARMLWFGGDRAAVRHRHGAISTPSAANLSTGRAMIGTVEIEDLDN
jgi:hypothetical protein